MIATPTHHNTRLPLWLRLYFYASENHCRRLSPGEVRQALGADRPADISRAINTAVRYGLLDPRSTARCLWVTPRVVR